MGTRRRAEAGPSPDWRRSHPGVLSSYLTRPGRHSGRPDAQAEGGLRARKRQTRPRTGGLGPPSPQERPAVDAAARLDSAREAVRKGACTRGYRTPVTAGLTPYPNPTRRPTSTRLASKDTELVSPNTVYRERVSGPIIPGEPFR